MTELGVTAVSVTWYQSQHDIFGTEIFVWTESLGFETDRLSSYVYWTLHHCDTWRIKYQIVSLAILFHFLCAQHVSDINISIIRSLRLFCWITTLVVLFLVRCVLELRCGWVGVVSVLQASACNTVQRISRKLLMMDILMSETCWSHKKWNKIASDIKLVLYSSTFLSSFYCTNLSPLNSSFETRYNSEPSIISCL